MCTKKVKFLLLKKGHRATAIFANADRLKAGEEKVPLELWSHPEQGLGLLSDKTGYWRDYSVLDAGLVPIKHCVKAQYIDDHFIKLEGHDKVLDIAFWKVEEKTEVNWVGGGPTMKDGPGRDFVINDDGSISPRSRLDLVLGF